MICVYIVLYIVLPPFENGNLMPSHQKGSTLWKNLLVKKILWQLSFLMVCGFRPFDPSFLVKFKLLAKESGKKSNLVSVFVVEILFALLFSMKRQKSLSTFESIYIILANSFIKNCKTCVKVHFLQQESKQTFPENL